MSMSLTIVDMVEAAARAAPRRVAMTVGNETLTYGDLLDQIGTWERELERVGVNGGERVLLAVEGRQDFTALWFALWRRSCVPIPLDHRIPTRELTTAASEGAANWVVCGEHILSIGLGDHFQGLRSWDLLSRWKIFRLEAQTPPERDHRPALLFYTSGTTGGAKCVAFDHEAITANIRDQITAFGLSSDDVCATPVLPTTPAALTTIVWPSLAVGASVVLLPQGAPSRMLQTMAQVRPTVFYAVPYLYSILCEAAKLRSPSFWHRVRLSLSSSAHLDPTVFDAFLESSGQPIRSLYCSSEGGSCTYNGSADLCCIRESVGTPLPGVQLSVADHSGRSCSAGQEGEIWVAGTHVASGYVGRPELQAQVFRDGWVRTGDLGTIDSRGYLYLTGRLSETINVGGYLVNPRSVEQVLREHPCVRDALVFSHPDVRLGATLAAKVVLREGVSAPSTADLVMHCADRLESYKVVRRIELVDELSRTRYGKIKRPHQRGIESSGAG